jgi:hypothetical protein
MNRIFGLLVAIALASDAFAVDRTTFFRAQRMLDDLNHLSTGAAQVVHRDADILRHLRAASRALDDWQKHVAVSKAADNISKAVQLSAQSSGAVRKICNDAAEIIGPAKSSPQSADLMQLRDALQNGPVEAMRTVVAEEMDVLARISTRMSELSSILTKAIADASSATLGKGD